jgi:tripartite motif-containing protein 71
MKMVFNVPALAGMKWVKRLVLVGGAAAVLALAACPSPFLEKIKEEIAKYPYTATSYSWLRQWGNAYKPEWTFVGPIVKTDTAGFVYVADSTFQIRKFNSSGVLQKTYALQTTLGLAGQVYDMAFDASGNMYAVTNNTNQIQKYTNAGAFVTDWGGSTVYGSFALTTPRAIAVDPSGNVYVTDTKQRVVKFSSSGAFQAEWAGTMGTAALGTSLYGIAVDRSSNVYVSDANNNRVVKLTSAGAFTSEWGGATPYPATTGTILSSPRGITLSTGTTQYVYLADRSNNRVVKTDTSGTNTTAVIVGLGAGTSDGYFNYPNTVAVDTSGSIYVGDDAGTFDRVQKFNSTPAWVATWGGAPGSADGVVANVGGVLLDSSDASYVVDVYNQRIEKFNSTGNYAGVKWGSSGSANSQFKFNGPPTIAMDSSGKIYVADAGNNRIQVFDSTGAYLNQWGTSGAGNGQFGSYSPSGVVVDSAGNIYAADTSNRRIQVFDSNGYYLRQWGSSGSGDGQFLSVYGIALDSSGNVYVSDMGSHRIQKFDSQGNLLLKWGSQGSADGQFQSPVGVTVDKYDHVFVADMGNRRVQKFDSSGNFLCKWGSIGSGSGSFAWVVGVGVNSHGHVLTTDWYGNLVQEFQPAQ